jgi:hypothetical protein
VGWAGATAVPLLVEKSNPEKTIVKIQLIIASPWPDQICFLDIKHRGLELCDIFFVKNYSLVNTAAKRNKQRL